MSEDQIERKVIRISILGDTSVGKTSIIRAYLNFEFLETNTSNIGTEKTDKKIKMKDGKEIKLIIWDTAGQERFRSMSTSYIKKSQGVILSFDITERRSFESLGDWLDVVKQNANIPIVLFGNKCDLFENRVVSKEEIEEFTKKNKIEYFETSARENIKIQEGFLKIVDMAYEKFKDSFNVTLKKDNKKKHGIKC